MTGFREFTSRSEMESSGWKISSSDTTCNKCGEAVTWSKSPSNKSVLLDSGATTVHWRSCSNGGAPVATKQVAPAVAPIPPTPKVATSEVRSLELAVLECAGVVGELTVAIRSLIAILQERRKQ